jgi:hypothetical protein
MSNQERADAILKEYGDLRRFQPVDTDVIDVDAIVQEMREKSLIDEYRELTGSSLRYDHVKKAMAECLQWIDSNEFDEFLDRMPREMAIRFLTQIATDISLEKDALTIRLRAEREYQRLKRQLEREEVAQLNINIDDI